MSPLIETTVNGVFVILAISLLLSLFRLIRGPQLPDRVVALDMIAIVVVGLVAVDAVGTNQSDFLRAGIVLALLAFLGTTAFAYYLRRPDTRE